jgi:hypothetical protein
MALQAQLKNLAKGGSLGVFHLRGTAAELAAYCASVPEGKLVKDGEIPLLFSSYIPFGPKSQWNETYMVLTGPNAGSYGLDKSALQIAELQLNGIKNATLATTYANSVVANWMGTSPATASIASQLTQPVAEEAPVEEVATEEVSTAAKADLTKAVK